MTLTHIAIAGRMSREAQMAEVCRRILAEATTNLPRTENRVTASPDAAVDSDGRSVPRRRGTSHALLTAAVLILIYERVPMPHGLTIARPWLQHALGPIGALLLADLGRRGIQTARLKARRVQRRLQKIAKGFQFAYHDNDDDEHV
jgi:hypothetical protein